MVSRRGRPRKGDEKHAVTKEEIGRVSWKEKMTAFEEGGLHIV